MAVFCEYASLDFANNILPRADWYSFQYDSPIEENLGELFAKYNDPYSDIAVLPQVAVQTSGGRFILDFLIIANGHKYAVECDGKEYHKYYHDLYRDSLLLGEDFIDEMIRFRGKDLSFLPNACLLFLGKLIPDFLSEKQLTAVEMTARTERWNLRFSRDPDGENFNDDMFIDDLTQVQGEYHCYNMGMVITCRHKRIKQYQDPKEAPDWLNAAEFIKQNNISSLQKFLSQACTWDIGQRLYRPPEQEEIYYENDDSYDRNDYDNDDDDAWCNDYDDYNVDTEEDNFIKKQSIL